MRVWINGVEWIRFIRIWNNKGSLKIQFQAAFQTAFCLFQIRFEELFKFVERDFGEIVI